jgi:hypothetical protein
MPRRLRCRAVPTSSHMGPCRISSSSRAQVVERLTLRTPETGKEKAVAKAVAAGAGGNGAGSSGDGSSQRQQAGRPPKAAQESISDVFWIPVLRVRLAVTCFLWFASGFSYYGLTLGVSSLAGNRYVNIAIMAAVEIPAVMLLIPLADSPWLGRKGATLIFFTVLGGCSALALLWSSDVGRITLNVVGRAASGTSARTRARVRTHLSMADAAALASGAAFTGVYLWSSELIPTSVRLGPCAHAMHRQAGNRM